MGLSDITVNLHSFAVGKTPWEKTQARKVATSLSSKPSFSLTPSWHSESCVLFLLRWIRGMRFCVLLLDTLESSLKTQSEVGLAAGLKCLLSDHRASVSCWKEWPCGSFKGQLHAVLLSPVGEESNIPASVLCCICQRRAGIICFNILLDKLWSSRGNKKPASLFVSFFSLCALSCLFSTSISPLPFHSPPELFVLWTSCLNTPPAAPVLIVTKTRISPTVRSSETILFARGRLPRGSKEANIYLREQRVNSNF